MCGSAAPKAHLSGAGKVGLDFATYLRIVVVKKEEEWVQVWGVGRGGGLKGAGTAKWSSQSKLFVWGGNAAL